MKNNTLCKVSRQNDVNQELKKRSFYGFLLLTGLLACQEGHAQFYNEGDVKVDSNTTLSVYEDYDNTALGSFINDGNVYIFKNWNNDGIVSFSGSTSKGTTFFNGLDGQFIEGTKQSDFQNIQFDNSFEAAPFYLGTKISVSDKAEFKQGIVDAVTLPGALVIFNENGRHEKAGDQSFVDGKVQKIGKKQFQFPVGAGKFFRPSEHEAAGDNIYTTQYFHKGANDDYQHSYDDRDESILKINPEEYWEVRQDKGADKIILSLTLDYDTTPADYYNLPPNTKLAIVRWDETKKLWVNENGKLSQPISGEAYSHLLTSQVSGYGLFTMAIVKDTGTIEDDGLIVYNAVSPNGDGLNDTFHIKGLDNFPDNTLEIYNRWGVKVYDAKGYNESDRMFAGYSDGRATINRGEKLPTGTYFYILKYNNGKQVREKAGYLYINNQ
ncbi:gliding motility-associated C-terminal domain-containing protein [Flavobacterium sp. KACC 22763]|uniref:gliding motility-associated C-terminal domain-containing protein n=1 Tax=Flavobacterium sp. KACC 22763 TaxID=3025668 RepID=UPI0023661FA4|nr:gliding motility-associated C-terminal domain-containing protein [Flavobacterium sp. KACC 22763]WDF66362.1 gliding motility-associated C-terminal domain-containing protein [Flavobacterium sp. KACC 22763]